MMILYIFVCIFDILFLSSIAYVIGQLFYWHFMSKRKDN